MKATVISQLLSKKSEPKQTLKHASKAAVETAVGGAAFSQFWNRSIRPEGNRVGLAKGKEKGEIAIPFLRREESTAAATGKISTGSVALKNADPIKKMPGTQFEQSNDPISLPTTGKKTPIQKSALPVAAQSKVREPDAMPGTEPKAVSEERGESAKVVSRKILDGLQKNGALNGLKTGDIARVEMDAPRKAPLKSGQEPVNGKAPKAAGSKIALTFKYAGKNGWQLVKGKTSTGKASVWKIRIVLPESNVKAVQTEPTQGKAQLSKAPTDEIVPEKKLLVTLLSTKKIRGKADPRASRSAVRLRVTVQSAAKASGVQANKTAQAFTLVTKGKDAQAVLTLTGKSSNEATANEAAQANANGSQSAMAEPRAEASQVEKSSVVAGTKNTAGAKPVKPVQNDLAAAGKELLKGNAGTAKTKVQSMPAVKPSALIERIESLLARATKGRAAANMKMQIQDSPFGKMDIQLEQKENRLSVVVETSKAKEAFLRLVPLIQNNLADKGYTLSEVQVSVGQFATQERKEGTAQKRKVKNLKTPQINGKEGDDHASNSPVTNRKFGYNTMEVTA